MKKKGKSHKRLTRKQRAEKQELHRHSLDTPNIITLLCRKPKHPPLIVSKK